jgi:hypothetical protein
MSNLELVATGAAMRLTMVNRNLPAPVDRRPAKGLGAAQVQWCEKHLKAFGWPRAERLKETV